MTGPTPIAAAALAAGGLVVATGLARVGLAWPPTNGLARLYFAAAWTALRIAAWPIVQAAAWCHARSLPSWGGRP